MKQEEFQSRFKSGDYLLRATPPKPATGSMVEVKSTGRIGPPPPELLAAMRPPIENRPANKTSLLALPRPSRRFKRPAVTVLIFALVIIAGGVLAYQFLKPTPPTGGTLGQSTVKFDLEPWRQYQAYLGFPLFYPRQLPDGYSVDTASYKTDQTNFSFIIQGPGVEQIAVNEQPSTANIELPASDKPQGSDIQVFQPHSFDTPAGKGTIMLRGGRYIGILNTDSTLIILNLTGTSTGTGKQIIQALTSL